MHLNTEMIDDHGGRRPPALSANPLADALGRAIAGLDWPENVDSYSRGSRREEAEPFAHADVGLIMVVDDVEAERGASATPRRWADAEPWHVDAPTGSTREVEG